MRKKQLKQFKQKLEKEKEKIREQLKTFAREDKKPKGDWDTRYPKFDSGKLEEEADEVGEYERLLSIEYNFELRLKNIERALEKIKKGKYGICEKCDKNISTKRLKVCPEARICRKCRPPTKK